MLAASGRLAIVCDILRQKPLMHPPFLRKRTNLIGFRKKNKSSFGK
jgi:hypothetical protein